MKTDKFTLVQYRDPGLSSYTHFWTTEQSTIYGPYFDSPEDANQWLNKSTKIVPEERNDDTT